MAIKFKDGSILFSEGGDISMHADCCCALPCCDEETLPETFYFTFDQWNIGEPYQDVAFGDCAKLCTDDELENDFADIGPIAATYGTSINMGTQYFVTDDVGGFDTCLRIQGSANCFTYSDGLDRYQMNNLPLVGKKQTCGGFDAFTMPQTDRCRIFFEWSGGTNIANPNPILGQTSCDPFYLQATCNIYLYRYQNGSNSSGGMCSATGTVRVTVTE